jgi:two-component system cell cycle sensor histidine kinase/response regulator CckA
LLQLHYTPFILPLVVSAAFCLGMLAVAWRNRLEPVAPWFAATVSTLLAWSVGYMFELMASGLQAKINWANLEFIAVIALPVLWLQVVLIYTRRRGLSTRAWLTLGSIGVLILVGIFLNPAGIFRGTPTLVVQGSLRALHPDYGPLWGFGGIPFEYGLLLFAAFVLVRAMRHAQRFQVRQSLALLAASLLPLAAGTIYVLGFSPRSEYNPAMAVVSVSGLLMTYALFSSHLFELAPLARDALIEHLADAVLVVDRRGRLVDLNRAALAVFPELSKEHLGRPVTAALAGRDDMVRVLKDAIVALSVKAGQQLPPKADEVEVRGGDLQETAHRVYSLLVTPVLNGAGPSLGLAVVLRDITGRKQAEVALREQGERYRSMFEAAPLAINVTRGTEFLYANPPYLEMFGLSSLDEMRDLAPLELFAPEWRPQIAENIQRRAGGMPVPNSYEVDCIRKDGTRIPVLMSLARTTFADGPATVGFIMDLTELKRTEAALMEREDQLRQAQKMEAVGQLAGGIAHDFNNLLTAVIGNASLVLMTMAEDDPNRELIADVQGAGERAAALTRQILAFSRRQVLQPEVLCLNDVVLGMEALLRRTLGEHIDMEFLLASDLAPTEVDPHQMEQVLMNLAVNARDAMPNGGRLRVETANIELDGSQVQAQGGARPGAHVTLTVSDTGCGMDDDTLSHMFEPFFTTKDVGEGTGLGLSTVFGIVKQSGGSISVSSEQGKGSTFRVYLPPRSVPRRKRQELMQPLAAATGSETVLVVEDEDSVRELVTRILSASGYVVRAADSAGQVRTVLDQDGVPDLLLTDVLLPGRTSGKEIADELRTVHPGLPIIFMSGYARDIVTHDGLLDDGVEFLQKPFTPEELLARVRTSLDAVPMGIGSLQG